MAGILHVQMIFMIEIVILSGSIFIPLPWHLGPLTYVILAKAQFIKDYALVKFTLFRI